MKRASWLSILLLTMGAPVAASAADGYLTANVNLRAGPDISYPRIDTLPAGGSVNIYGCTDGWAWCDVSYRGDRGWIAGNYIDYYQNDRPMPVPSYGAQIGIPIISFIIGNYWGQHYSHRSFYRQRTYWYRRPVPHRAPPPRPSRPWYRPGTPTHYQPGHSNSRPSAGHSGHSSGGQSHPGYRPNPGNPHRPDNHQGNRPNPSQHQQPRPATHPAPRPQQTHQGARPASAARPASSHHSQGRPAPAKGESKGHTRGASDSHHKNEHGH